VSADSQDFTDFQGRARRLALPLLFRSAWPQPIKTNARIAQGPDAAVARKLESDLPLQIVDYPERQSAAIIASQTTGKVSGDASQGT
jgi:hypothetical protein